jgi:hypothetical protein
MLIRRRAVICVSKATRVSLTFSERLSGVY